MFLFFFARNRFSAPSWDPGRPEHQHRLNSVADTPVQPRAYPAEATYCK